LFGFAAQPVSADDDDENRLRAKLRGYQEVPAALPVPLCPAPPVAVPPAPMPPDPLVTAPVPELPPEFDPPPPPAPEDAAYFVAWMDRVIQAAEARGGWNSEQEKADTLSYLHAAREKYRALAAKKRTN